jgi:hypothetical protein
MGPYLGDETFLVLGADLEAAVALKYLVHDPDAEARKRLLDRGKIPARGSLGGG